MHQSFVTNVLFPVLDHEPCLRIECLNGGYCQETMPSSGVYMCVCQSGWAGDRCQYDRDECLEDRPCKNGGSCFNLVGSYYCECPPGLEGDTCEIGTARLILAPHFRRNCVKGITLPSFFYSLAFLSINKQVNVLHVTVCESPCVSDLNECLTGVSLCMNGGTCTNTFGSYYCTCVDGWTGTHCREGMADVTLETLKF